MHLAQTIFVKTQKVKYPEKFTGLVVEFGSLDINGSNRSLCGENYIGVDIIKGKNVDVVCKCHEFKTDLKLDLVLSTEMLEHDPFYKKSLLKMYELLNKGGILVLTTAGIERPEHDPYEHQYELLEGFEFYKNFTKKEIQEIYKTTKWKELNIIETGSDIYVLGVK